jgi:hypothetical protein
MRPFVVLFIFLSANLFSQEIIQEKKTASAKRYLTDLPDEELLSDENQRMDFHGKTIFIFRTFEDYQNDASEKLGYFWHYAEKRIDGWREDKSDFSLDPNEVWGFIIDGITFRCLKKHNPLMLITQKEKVFYANGYFFLHGWNNYSEDTKFFYSDDIESPVFSLEQFMSGNKSNLKYMSLFQCIKEAKRGKKAEINSKIYRCLANFE